MSNPVILIVVIVFSLFSCKNKEIKSFPIDATINSEYQENIIEEDEIKINIPVGWNVYSEEKKQIVLTELNSNSQYEVKFDFFLRLNTDDVYPSASVSINQSPEFSQLSFEDFAKQFLKTYSDNIPTILDGNKSVITEQNNIGSYIDRKNKILYIIDEAQVSNQGNIKTISAIILKKDYLVAIVLNSRPETFEKYKSSFSIMVNSTRI
jgi:uncharacterized membrane-anchored protein YitT (DUF2179 family)